MLYFEPVLALQKAASPWWIVVLVAVAVLVLRELLIRFFSGNNGKRR